MKPLNGAAGAKLLKNKNCICIETAQSPEWELDRNRGQTQRADRCVILLFCDHVRLQLACHTHFQWLEGNIVAKLKKNWWKCRGENVSTRDVCETRSLSLLDQGRLIALWFIFLHYCIFFCGVIYAPAHGLVPQDCYRPVHLLDCSSNAQPTRVCVQVLLFSLLRIMQEFYQQHPVAIFCERGGSYQCCTFLFNLQVPAVGAACRIAFCHVVTNVRWLFGLCPTNGIREREVTPSMGNSFYRTIKVKAVYEDS